MDSVVICCQYDTDARNWLAERHVVEISTTQDFDLAATVRSHGWVKLAPYSWSGEGRTLTWSVQLENTIVPIEVRQITPRQLRVEIPKDVALQMSTMIEAIVRRVLMLDWDPSDAIIVARALDSDVANLLAKGAGRLLRGMTAFEDVVKTVCTINTSWSNTVNIVQRIVSEYGDGAFPTPEKLAAVPPEKLRTTTRAGYRSEIISQLARLEASGHDLAHFTWEQLLSIKGLGPYSVDHIMVLRGDYSRIPVDSEVTKYCVNMLGLELNRGPNAIQQYFSEWGQYRFLGYKLGRMARNRNWIGESLQT